MSVTFDNTTFSAAQSTSGVILGSSFNGTSLLSGATPVTIDGTINSPNSTVTVDLNLAGTPIVGATGTYAGFSTTPQNDFVYYFDVQGAGITTPVAIAVTGASTLPALNVLTSIDTSNVSAPVGPNTPCFCTGTMIRVVRDGVGTDIPVEELRIGDVAVTASGTSRPIIWIGHRDLDGCGRSLAHDLQPIRVRAGAFGPSLPARDLRLSPGHPVLVGAEANGDGGYLVPIMCLINGTSIVRERARSVTYWHVELDRHDVLLAEGLAAESYLDWGDRPFFDEGSDHALHNPNFVVPGLTSRCRPVAVDGPMVEAERARLSIVFAAELTSHCGWDADIGLDALAA